MSERAKKVLPYAVLMLRDEWEHRTFVQIKFQTNSKLTNFVALLFPCTARRCGDSKNRVFMNNVEAGWLSNAVVGNVMKTGMSAKCQYIGGPFERVFH